MSTSSDTQPVPRFVPPPLPRRAGESSSDEVEGVFKRLPSLEHPAISGSTNEHDEGDNRSNPEPTLSEPLEATATTTGSPLGRAASKSPKSLIGTILLDRYRVVEMLGEGAMGAVFMGEHVTIGRKVAIKVLKLHAARSPEKAKERFLREARMISMISHDNVVQISDFGETVDGLPFFVMEYLEGEDLALLLRREGRQSWARVKVVAIQICRALRAAHSVGVIHRDMKLENCFMVTRPDVEDFVKVLDFGIAKIMAGDDGQKPDGERLARLTRTGEVVGTAAYMAPEQAKGEPLDARTDLYSLGVMLYELLVGRRPFEAESIVGLMHKQAYEIPQKPSEVAPHAGITPSMESVILKALAKSPDERYQNAGEMIEAIEMVSARTPAHPNLSGETLQGRYKLIERIGEGGMGTVYLARHTTIGRRLAVKVLHTEYVRMYKGRFLQEAKAASQITHDNVVQITDYGETSAGQPFLVMEYLEGESLSDTIKRECRLPWSRVKHISTQICRGLQSAHDAGIIHRDIKPDNCFRVSKDDNDDHIKILDFGIARMNNAGPKITITGDIIGTAAYMAPEQARGDKEVDHRADIYGVGIMMYEMLVGVRPFEGDDDFVILHHHIYSQPKPISHHTLAPQIPRGAEAIVLKAIEKSPADRYISMREMVKAIASVMDDAPIVEPPPVEPPAVEHEHPVRGSVLTGELYQPNATNSQTRPSSISFVSFPAVSSQVTPLAGSQPSSLAASHPVSPRTLVPPPTFPSPTIPEVRQYPESVTGSHPAARSAAWAPFAAGLSAFVLLWVAVYFSVLQEEPALGAVSTAAVSARGQVDAALHQLEKLTARPPPQPEPEPEPPPDGPGPGPDPKTKPKGMPKKSGKAKVRIERVGYGCVEGVIDPEPFKIEMPKMTTTLVLEPGKHFVKYGACGSAQVNVGTITLGADETQRLVTKNPPRPITQ
jgi:serine/threonine protein kinase